MREQIGCDPGRLLIPGKCLEFNRPPPSDYEQGLGAESVQGASSLSFLTKGDGSGGFISSVTTVTLSWLSATTFAKGQSSGAGRSRGLLHGTVVSLVFLYNKDLNKDLHEPTAALGETAEPEQAELTEEQRQIKTKTRQQRFSHGVSTRHQADRLDSCQRFSANAFSSRVVSMNIYLLHAALSPQSQTGVSQSSTETAPN